MSVIWQLLGIDAGGSGALFSAVNSNLLIISLFIRAIIVLSLCATDNSNQEHNALACYEVEGSVILSRHIDFWYPNLVMDGSIE